MLSNFLVWASISQAEPLSQDRLDTFWATAGQLRLGESGYLIGEEPIDFNDGICRFSLRSGVLIPILSGRVSANERIVGVAFVGEGDLSHRFPERADALRFANHMARYTDADLPLEALVRDGEPVQMAVDRGMILSVDPQVIRMLTELEPIRAGVVISEGEDGFDEEFVVNAERRRMMQRAVSTNVLADRSRYLRGTGLDPAAIVRQDRLLYDELGVSGEQLRVVADFRTAHRFYVTERREQFIGGKGYDRWLTCYRDERDLSDTGFRAMSFTHGTDADGQRRIMRLGGDPLPTSRAGPAQQLVPVHADTTIDATVRGPEHVAAAVSSTLRLRATGGGTRYVMLKLPSGVTRAGGWALGEISLPDKTPLPFVEIHAGLQQGRLSLAVRADAPGEREAKRLSRRMARDHRDDDAPIVQRTGKDPEDRPYRSLDREVLVILPEVLEDGEEITLELSWRAKWPYSYNLDFGQTKVHAGMSTGPQPFLPEIIPSSGGTRWDHSTVAVLDGREDDAIVISGRTLRRERGEDAGRLLVESEGRGAIAPRVVVGRWKSSVSLPGAPSAHIRLFEDAGSWGVNNMALSALRFVQRRLGPLPSEEIEVYQDVHVIDEHLSLGGDGAGMVGLQGVFVENGPEPSLIGMAANRGRLRPLGFMVTRQVAQLFWGPRVSLAGPRAEWLLDALSDAWALAYLDENVHHTSSRTLSEFTRARFEGVADDHNVVTNAFFEDDTLRVRTLSLSTPDVFNDAPPDLRSLYGTQVLSHMLRVRIGDDAYRAAMAEVAALPAEQPLDTARFKQAVEAHAGRDLSDFFDYWVHGGYLPDVDVSFRVSGGTIAGCVRSNIAYGTFDIPIWIDDDQGTPLEELRVEVRDGLGRFERPIEVESPQLRIDPDDWTLTRSRSVEKVRKLDCLGG